MFGFSEQKLRVGVIAGPYIPVPPAKYGGTELIIYYLIKGLKEAGHEPILFGAGDSSVDCEIIPIVDKAIYFPAKKEDYPAYLRLSNQIERQARQKVRENFRRLDIIHSHGVDLLDLQDFPNITTNHGPVDFPLLKFFLARKKMCFASISKNQQDACPNLQYIGVVYNGEDPNEFPVVRQPENYLCFLGRFDHEKNPHLAIELALNLGMKIKLAGKIDFLGAEYFEEMIRPHLNHPLVEYLGELGFDDKVELLSKAKCNLHPTGFREPFGLDVLEAAYCGTPTLAIDRGSMPELIEEGRTGLLVEDFVEGFHHVEKCFEMDRTYIARRARALFNYKTMAEQYVEAYRKVINIFKAKEEKKRVISSVLSSSSVR